MRSPDPAPAPPLLPPPTHPSPEEEPMELVVASRWRAHRDAGPGGGDATAAPTRAVGDPVPAVDRAGRRGSAAPSAPQPGWSGTGWTRSSTARARWSASAPSPRPVRGIAHAGVAGGVVRSRVPWARHDSVGDYHVGAIAPAPVTRSGGAGAWRRRGGSDRSAVTAPTDGHGEHRWAAGHARTSGSGGAAVAGSRPPDRRHSRAGSPRLAEAANGPRSPRTLAVAADGRPRSKSCARGERTCRTCGAGPADGRGGVGGRDRAGARRQRTGARDDGGVLLAAVPC